MANNRLYLYCPPCNQHTYIGKCYADGYFDSTRDYGEIGATIMDFLDEHFWCDGGESRHLELRWESHHKKAKRLPLDSKPSPSFSC